MYTPTVNHQTSGHGNTKPDWFLRKIVLLLTNRLDSFLFSCRSLWPAFINLVGKFDITTTYSYSPLISVILSNSYSCLEDLTYKNWVFFQSLDPVILLRYQEQVSIFTEPSSNSFIFLKIEHIRISIIQMSFSINSNYLQITEHEEITT